MIDTKKAFSRPLAVAAATAARAGRKIDEESFLQQLVVLTAEASALHTENGRWCYFDALRLLIRVAGRLVVTVPPGFNEIETEVRAVCGATAFRTLPTVVVGRADAYHAEAAAVLNVGCEARPDLPWISVSAAGWVSHASTNGIRLQSTFAPANPISSLFAASVGVSEVFRRLVGISTDTIPNLGVFQTSLFDLADMSGTDGPIISSIALPNAVLVGAGAIGSAVALLASQLPLRGCLHIVDNQKYGEENLGTSVLVENQGWIGEPKALRLAEWLSANSQLDVTGEENTIKEALGALPFRELSPEVLVNALDDVQARHDAQMLWPSYTFDAGIGEFGMAVTQHRLDDRGLACLRCSFKLPQRNDKEVQRLATGLTAESLQDLDRELTMDDVAKAAPEKREWLAARVRERETICSVCSEATLARQGVDAEENFRPSVPFVATAAAALLMAEIVKTALDRNADYHQSLVIGNLMLGHASVARRNRAAEPTCICVQHRAQIEYLRKKRGNPVGPGHRWLNNESGEK